MSKKGRVRYSNGQLFWDLVKGAKFDGRKFLFFASVGVIAFGGLFLAKNVQLKGLNLPAARVAVAPLTGGETGETGDRTDGSDRSDKSNIITETTTPEAEAPGGITTFSNPDRNLTLTSDGKLLENGKEIGKINQLQSFDEIKYVVFDQPGNYLDGQNVILSLPKPIASDQLKIDSFAVHGIESKKETVLDDKTVLFTATNIAPESTYTIAVQFPKNYFNFSVFSQVFARLKALPVWVWIIISSLLPLITLIVLLNMVARRLKDVKTNAAKEVVTAPPADLPPAVVGVLLRGKLAEREIAATILDLLIRGQLNIYLKNISAPGGENVTFLRRKGTDIKVVRSVALFEEILLEKMSLLKNFKSDEEEIENRINRHIFSGKIAAIYKEIYQMATALGYFLENPTVVHQRYKNFGLIAVFIGMFSFGAAAIFGRDFYFLFLSAAGLVVAGFIIISLSGNLPLRTEKGREATSLWLAFGNFLAAKRELTQAERTQELFIKYLPYAIVLNRENEWAQKFLAFPPSIPVWFDAQKSPRTIEEFYKQSMTILAQISKELVAAKEPTVE